MFCSQNHLPPLLLLLLLLLLLFLRLSMHTYPHLLPRRGVILHHVVHTARQPGAGARLHHFVANGGAASIMKEVGAPSRHEGGRRINPFPQAAPPFSPAPPFPAGGRTHGAPPATHARPTPHHQRRWWPAAGSESPPGVDLRRGHVHLCLGSGDTMSE